jgi:hypothetical protein
MICMPDAHVFALRGFVIFVTDPTPAMAGTWPSDLKAAALVALQAMLTSKTVSGNDAAQTPSRYTPAREPYS